MRRLVIMKFGGTSVGSADAIRKTAKIVTNFADHTVVVVSAMAGVTDLLIHSVDIASRGQQAEIDELIKDIRDKHIAVTKSLRLPTAVSEEIDSLVSTLKETLYRIAEQRLCSPAESDQVLSYGERLSVRLVSAAIKQQGADSVPIEATQLIITSRNHGNAEPYLDDSTQNIEAVLRPLIARKTIAVVTGFIGATTDGEITTLGRGASDYTATILAYCLEAQQVWIWTDVAGIMTADPSSVSGTKTIAELSYREAAELSYFGAKVIHPLTMVPASKKNIPIFIKNTFEPSEQGTKIFGDTVEGAEKIKAVASRGGLTLLTVRGAGIVGTPSVAARVLGVLASDRIEVFLISQASSDRSISLMVDGADSISIAERIHAALSTEMSHQKIDTVELKNNLVLVAVVGSGVNTLQGVTSRAFTALGTAGVEVVAIAHGSSSHSFSLAVNATGATKAVETLHKTFQLTKGD